MLQTLDDAASRDIHGIAQPADEMADRGLGDIQRVAQLKGKRIGTFPGSTMRLYARLGLRPELQLPKDAELIELRSDMQLTGLVHE